MERLREKVGGSGSNKTSSMKRPSACMKKPAAAEGEAKSKVDKPKEPKATQKKTTAVRKGNQKKQKRSKPPNALALYPKGCPKCRYKPGCTPSCFKQRKEWS